MKKRQPIAAYLVFIEKNWCSRVLESLRKIPQSESTVLHKHTMSISWSAQDAFTELHGRELARLIRQHVRDQRLHVSEKIRRFNELGYVDRAKRYSVRVKTDNRNKLNRELSDLAVGRRSTFPGDWTATVSDIRFGIEAPLQSFDSSTGKLEYHAQPQGNVRMTLSTHSTPNAVTIDCQVYRAKAVFPFLPDEHDQIRLATEDIAVTFPAPTNEAAMQSGARVEFTIPAYPVTLGRPQLITRIGAAIARQDRDGLSISLMMGERSFEVAGGVIPDASELQETIEQLDTAIEACLAFGVAPTELVTTDGILRQADGFHLIAKIMSAERTGPARAPFAHEVSIGEKFGFIDTIQVALPDSTLSLVIGAFGVATDCAKVEEIWLACAGDGQMIYKTCIDRGEPSPNGKHATKIREEVRACLDQYGCRFVYDTREIARQLEPSSP